MFPEILKRSLLFEYGNKGAAATANSSKQLYCFCQVEEYGNMIMCDNPSCKYIWFHYGCVGIVRAHKVHGSVQIVL